MSENSVGAEPDLAELISRLLPALAAAESPILEVAGVSMWEYAILSTLSREVALSQVELSRRTGRDTTRLGKHLSDLESRDLVVREQASDARQRTVALTAAGRALHDGVKGRVRSAEDGILSGRLSADQATELRRLLALLVSD